MLVRFAPLLVCERLPHVCGPCDLARAIWSRTFSRREQCWGLKRKEFMYFTVKSPRRIFDLVLHKCAATLEAILHQYGVYL